MQNEKLYVFNPDDPFPLVSGSEYNYELAKNHSASVDKWLGFEYKSAQALEGVQTWNHLSPQLYQTPYIEIRMILEQLSPQVGQTIIDLGCGFARMAFVLNRHFPDVFFKGYEFDPHRVQETQEKLTNKNSEIFQQDLADPNFTPPPAEFYFMFDYGTHESIHKTLNDLQKIARTRSITVVGRGRATRHFIQEKHLWLSHVNEPLHYPQYSIYKS